MISPLSPLALPRIVAAALEEDLGRGDVTTDALGDAASPSEPALEHALKPAVAIPPRATTAANRSSRTMRKTLQKPRKPGTANRKSVENRPR